MQKSASGAGSKSVVGDIFRTMAYNENPVENFSSILNWLPSGDKICSIVNGKLLDSPATSPGYKFNIAQKIVKVGVLDAKNVESILSSVKHETECWEEKAALDRLARFEKLVKRLEGDLCLVESVGTGVPSWQIAEYDSPAWRSAGEILSENASFAEVGRTLELGRKKGKVVHILMKLKREEYCLRSLLKLIILSILFEGKFVLSISTSSTESSSLLLPVFFLVDAVNKAKIRATNLDLLIMDSSRESLSAIFKNPTCDQLLVWNGLDELGKLVGGLQQSPVELYAGVLIPERIRSIHFILDSSADVKSAVEGIAEETWCSGTRVNLRARSLLFVHQPIYKEVVTLLEKKVGTLRISEESSHSHHKSADFITRTQEQQHSFNFKAELEKVLGLGVKIIPSQSQDLSGPTVLYEIGTSVDIIANKVPGLGHILCVIPFRSNTELLSLANNHGSMVQTRIYASDSAVVKKLVGNLKGEEIWVNSSGKLNQNIKTLTSINDSWLFLHSRMKTKDEQQHKSVGKDGFPLGEAEKAAKAWTLLSSRDKLQLVEKVLETSCPSLEMSDRLGQFIELLKMTGQQEEEDGNWESVTLRRTRAVGIVGFMVEQSISTIDTILPILITVLKGNAVIVVGQDNNIASSIVQGCNSNFPPGLVNFINCKDTFTHTFKQFGDTGKISLACLIHSGDPLERGLDLDAILAQQKQGPALVTLCLGGGNKTTNASLKCLLKFVQTTQLVEL